MGTQPRIAVRAHCGRERTPFRSPQERGRCGEHSLQGRCLRDSMRGFTLLELLVSMTLMGLLAVAIHFGFRIGVNAWGRADNGLQRVRAIQAAFDLLSRQLGSMVPYYSQQKINDAPVEVLLYQGTEKGMRFVTTFSSQSRNAGGFRLVEYFLSSSKEKSNKAFVINERALIDDESLSQSVFSSLARREGNSVVANFFEFGVHPDSIYLIDGVDEAQFRYFQHQSSNETSNPGGAVAPAQKKEHLPTGVEIKLHWNESGIFSGNDFSIVIPIHTAGLSHTE